MNRFIATLGVAAAFGAVGTGLTACGSSQPSHHAEPKKQSCEVQVDQSGYQYCRVVVPPHSQNNPSPDPLAWYYVWLINGEPSPYSPKTSVNAGGGSWQRSPTMPSGLSSLPTPTAVKVDEKGEPEEGEEAVQTVEEAEQAGEEVVNETSEVSEVSDAVDPAADTGGDVGGDTSGGDSSGGDVGGGDSGGGGDAGGGGDGGGGGGE